MDRERTEGKERIEKGGKYGMGRDRGEKGREEWKGRASELGEVVSWC